ncbi:hypothetical protein PILCRDRAFT_12366 [Piloderma croceum F 1598]|uniref:C2H2-type domain-containing protein n=1 Tax=Piloderma croceum (strain F 1598) TaxID=765440 RepID=A0A0C3BHZ8_PILCF|nr:hypothetical protein PILCRDRAFT_12366 [Piloderma croceum F 1598]
MNSLHTPAAQQPRFTCSQCVRRFFNRAGLKNHVRAKHPHVAGQSQSPPAHGPPSPQQSRNEEQLPPPRSSSVKTHNPEFINPPSSIRAEGHHGFVQPPLFDDNDYNDYNNYDNYHDDSYQENNIFNDDLSGSASRSSTPIFVPSSQICDKYGNNIPVNSPSPPRKSDLGPNDWTPYQSRVEFELADFLYHPNQMSATDINYLLNLWGASSAAHGEAPPFPNHKDLYSTIDSTPLGDVSWESFSLRFNGARPNDAVPPWMNAEYDVWFRNPRNLVHNIISNPDFNNSFDYAPYQEHDANGTCRYHNFMSGNWAWRQADLISENPKMHRSFFCPIILRSDKTTVSVATGHNEYWPVYLSIGNIHNNVQRAHRNGLVLLGFLAILKNFRKFRRQLLHSSLAKMLECLKPFMTEPDIVRCTDGHFRRAIYGLGPYIADYPEQCLLACIVQGWCPRCTAPSNDLNGRRQLRRSRAHTDMVGREFELGTLWDEYGIVGDVILIKGVFKDYIVTRVTEYIKAKYPEWEANRILDDIDRRITLAPSFAGLRRFTDGRGFKQWTGDDSKALMKVYLPAIEGYVPQDMHSRLHYLQLIRAFGTPNGLCSSITESKHIKAVKEPWRRSNRFNALSEMLLTNQQLDKLAAARVDFAHRGMLQGMSLDWALSRLALSADPQPGPEQNPASQVLDDNNGSPGPQVGVVGDMAVQALGRNKIADEEDDDGDVVAGPTIEASVTLAKTPWRRVYADDLATDVDQPDLILLIQQFLYAQEHPDSDSLASQAEDDLPPFREKITVYPSAVTTFYSPSDVSGVGGMRNERICSVDSWRKGPARYDCIFVETDPDAPGMRGLDIARVRFFFSFICNGTKYPCALVHWFSHMAELPDRDTVTLLVPPLKDDDDDLRQIAGVISSTLSEAGRPERIRAMHCKAGYPTAGDRDGHCVSS